MSRYGTISLSLMNCQMIRVISSPSSSTTGFFTLILLIRKRLHLARPRAMTRGAGRGNEGAGGREGPEAGSGRAREGPYRSAGASDHSTWVWPGKGYCAAVAVPGGFELRTGNR